MSAYVVNDHVIHKIVSWFELKQAINDYDYAADLLAEEYDLTDSLECLSFGQDLHRLNVDSVNDRYGDDTEGFSYQHKMIAPPTRMQAYKAIEVWRYNACEGDCDQTKLYKLMTRVYDAMAHKIINELEAYKKVPWGE